MTFATLRELHALIGTAIDDIERAYLNASPNSAPSEHPQQSPPPPPPPIPPLPPLSTSPSPCSSPSHYSPVSEYSEEDPNDGDISALPTPVSVTFAIPPVKKKRPTRSRAYTLPPISPTTDIPPLWAPPKSILREPPTEPPLDFPDLDLPYFPTPLRKPADQFSSDSNVPSVQQRAEQRTRDRNTKAEDLTTDVDVVNAANKIIAACTQLSASLQKPFLTICDAAMGVRTHSSSF